ncbi:trypsin-like peptidase domain-containing protein [Corallococcus sp. BB11-1]|uniref:trypsin-like peptidase domain-containing protein n=1 Tax=Corallococcus sp. BB11-1 TaxID=2996783 RepID=UPI00226DAF72|nr:trypsin-like peptidase domain-containing protein [Corallococcus sp. BB11-1]MCY1036059.1 trypsin-like peptidase domain-containing protein [Corallococcus sp. BB11-1]
MARRVSCRSVPVRLFSVLCVLALAPVAEAAEDPLLPWLQARVREHTAFFAAPPPPSAVSEGTVGPSALWRERAPGSAGVPQFVPPTSLAPLIRAVEAGVVNITTVGPGALPGAVKRSTGSGFVLTPDGLVVTNNHVVANAQGPVVAPKGGVTPNKGGPREVPVQQVSVRLADGREFPAEVVGRDASTDVALLRLSGAGLGTLPAVFLGDSDVLEVGDWVVAIGNPFGLDHSVAHGMISAKERVLGVGQFDDFIQTDALINPGNSGGPLFNMRGEVIGVNTAIISEGQGIGFAVPINLVKDLLPNLRENGKLERGWLGVVINEDGQHSTTTAPVVKDVYRGSPAAAANIRPGDRLVAVNGRPIGSYLQLLRKVALLAPGTEAKLTLLREGGTQEVAVRLVARPAQEATEGLANRGGSTTNDLGLVLRDLTPEVAAPLGYDAFVGALVSGIVPRSAAEQSGLRAGDVITEVNRRRVKDAAGVKAALERGSAGASILLRVQRGDALQYIAIAR